MRLNIMLVAVARYSHLHACSAATMLQAGGRLCECTLQASGAKLTAHAFQTLWSAFTKDFSCRHCTDRLTVSSSSLLRDVQQLGGLLRLEAHRATIGDLTLKAFSKQQLWERHAWDNIECLDPGTISWPGGKCNECATSKPSSSALHTRWFESGPQSLVHPELVIMTLVIRTCNSWRHLCQGNLLLCQHIVVHLHNKTWIQEKVDRGQSKGVASFHHQQVQWTYRYRISTAPDKGGNDWRCSMASPF